MRIFFTILFYLLINTAFAVPNPSIKFIKNEGQWDASVLFKADIAGGYLLVKQQSLQYVFYDTKALADIHFGNKNEPNSRTISSISGHSFEMSFKECNQNSSLKTPKPNQIFHNYFIGNDPTHWKTNVPTYDEITLQNIYEGIDFRLYSLDQNLKYEYIVKPNADISKIRMKYEGLDEIKVENQQIKYRTSVNIVKEFEPYSYQIINNKNVEIASKFRLKDNEVSFELPENYDKSKTLVIDPELVFSTYSGSRADNWAQTATYDSDGNLYAGGTVFGSQFPVTVGSFQTTVGGAQIGDSFLGVASLTDIVIMKFSADGSQLLYSTFLGGQSSEVAHSLITNSKGQLVIFGTTASRNFPTSGNAFQRAFGGGTSVASDPLTTQIGMVGGTDIFVAVLSKDGKQLVGSTYVGGSSNDGINDTRNLEIRNYGDEFRGEVFVDKNDNIYFASTTTSTNFPLKNAFQNVKSTSSDAVICKLSADCTTLLWGTYLGGNGFDNATGIRVTADDEIFVCGATTSTNLASKTDALNPKNSGKLDGYIAKYSNNSLVQLTYLGTNQSDLTALIDIDKNGNVYALGLTNGAYPINGAVYNKPNSGQYIHCLDKNLTKTNFSLTFGTGRAGKVDIVPTAFLVNDCGNIYVAGWGGKINFPTESRTLNANSTTTGLQVTDDAIQKTTTGNNFYFMILESEAKSLLYGTFFGGNPADFPKISDERGDHVDGGTCRFDKNGIIYHSACSCRSSLVSFPLKNAYSSSHNSDNCNMAAFKIDLGALKADFDISDGTTQNPKELCAPANLSFQNKSIGAKSYEWELNGNVVSRLKDFTARFALAGEYKMKLKIYNKITCKFIDSTERVFRIRSFESSAAGDTSVCSDTPVQLKAAGGDKYTWSPSVGLNASNIANPIAKASSTTKYTVTIERDGCKVNRDVTVKVDNAKPDFIVSPTREICKGQEITLGVTSKAIKTTWVRPNLPDTVATFITVKPQQSTTYTVKAEYTDGCIPQKDIRVIINDDFKPNFDYSITQSCNKPYELIFTNSSQNASKFIWKMGNGDSLAVKVPENYRYTSAGNYNITLKAYNSIGCELVTTKSIEIPDADGKVPNIITPNNDGKNDTFVVGYKDTHLQIFDRWGKLVYESEKYQNDWGKGIYAGTFYFVIKLTDGNECKGFLTVLN